MVEKIIFLSVTLLPVVIQNNTQQIDAVQKHKKFIICVALQLVKTKPT